MAYQNRAFVARPPVQITQQEDYSFTVEFAEDVSSFTFFSEVRPAPGVTGPVTFDIDTSHAGTDPYSITLTLDSSLTTDMEPGPWVYDVWKIPASGTGQKPVVFGVLSVNAAVSEIGDMA